MVSGSVRVLEALPAEASPPREAFAYCRALTRSQGENFTVISWLTPPALRRHVAALYAYCRTVDDLGDEATGDRHRLLDRWEEELYAAYRGDARHPVLVALQESIARFSLPHPPFERLIEANRMDQGHVRYDTFDQLLRYCEHSANPVGELVLALYGVRDDQAILESSKTCTALQLTNFWQDVRRDALAGRIYLPQEDLTAFGVCEGDLLAGRSSDGFLRMMRFQVDRARTYFAGGLPLLRRVPAHLRFNLALFTRGGLAILKKIERQGFDTLQHRPTLSRWEKTALAVSSLLGPGEDRWM